MYALPDAVRWYVHRELSAHGVANGDRLDPATERALLDRRRRETIEFTTAIKHGEYVKARDVELRWARRVVTARDHLRSLPAALRLRMGHLSRAEEAIVAEVVEESLCELADQPAPGEEEEYATNGNGQHGPVHRRGANDPGPLAGQVPASS